MTPADFSSVTFSPSVVAAIVGTLAVVKLGYDFFTGAVRKTIIGDIKAGDIMTEKKCGEKQTGCSHAITSRLDALDEKVDNQGDTISFIKEMVMKLTRANPNISNDDIDKMNSEFVGKTHK